MPRAKKRLPKGTNFKEDDSTLPLQELLTHDNQERIIDGTYQEIIEMSHVYSTVVLWL